VPTDLRLFRLVSDPGLSTLPIAAVSPPLTSEALLIGRGRNRGAPYTFGSTSGWHWLTTSSKRWGTNNVSQAGIDVNPGGGPVRMLAFSFNNVGGTEAMATVGDSGGSAFVNGELAGIMIAIWTYGGQAPQTSVFGNGTYVADLSYYHDQILTVTAERACSNGVDDDGDGLVDDGDAGCYGADDPFETNAIVPCDDGFDSDGDGLIDWPDDPGCQTVISLMEDPACDDGADNDGDLFVDWDGGGVALPDPQCSGKPWRNSEAPPPPGCGLGFELVLLAPLLARTARRRRA
jgi:hypothetical protein